VRGPAGMKPLFFPSLPFPCRLNFYVKPKRRRLKSHTSRRTLSQCIIIAYNYSGFAKNFCILFILRCGALNRPSLGVLNNYILISLIIIAVLRKTKDGFPQVMAGRPRRREGVGRKTGRYLPALLWHLQRRGGGGRGAVVSVRTRDVCGVDRRCGMGWLCVGS